MKEEIKTIGRRNATVIEYDSLAEFYKYICETPINEAFRWQEHSSVSGNKHFTGTVNFEEAVQLFKEGWSTMAEQLVTKMNVEKNLDQPTMKQRSVYDVAGYQCSVPRYLQSIPTSMINKKNFAVKDKVITINKSIDYHAGVSTDEIIDQSIKAMRIIKKIESQGIRVNLNIILGSSDSDARFYVKVRIKSASEKLNVSKLAFPLVHPSMLRRLFFRFIEVYPTIPESFTLGYGTPARTHELREVIGKKEYLLPSFITKDITQINGIEDL